MVSPLYFGFPAQLIPNWKSLVKPEMAANNERGPHDSLPDQSGIVIARKIVTQWWFIPARIDHSWKTIGSQRRFQILS
jgi:hypothetical protein